MLGTEVKNARRYLYNVYNNNNNNNNDMYVERFLSVAVNELNQNYKIHCYNKLESEKRSISSRIKLQFFFICTTGGETVS